MTMTRKPTKKAADKQVSTAKARSTAVAVHQPKPPTSMLELIYQGSRDPDFDLEKFKFLVGVQQAGELRAKEDRYNEAMNLVQAELKPIRADLENKQTKSKYASEIALDNAIRPIYSKHGFSISWDTEDAPVPEMVRVVAYVACAGHKEKKRFDVPADGKGAKGGDVMTKTHAAVSAVTVGRSVLTRMIFNLIVKGKRADGADDDGNAASGTVVDQNATITDAQLKELQKLLATAPAGPPLANVFRFVEKRTNITLQTPSEIPANIFSDLMAGLREWKTNATKK